MRTGRPAGRPARPCLRLPRAPARLLPPRAPAAAPRACCRPARLLPPRAPAAAPRACCRAPRACCRSPSLPRAPPAARSASSARPLRLAPARSAACSVQHAQPLARPACCHAQPHAQWAVAIQVLYPNFFFFLFFIIK